MTQTGNTLDNADHWRPLGAWPVEKRPAVLWPWLANAGSLTEKLRAVVKADFHVRLLHQGHASLDADDAGLLQAQTGTAAHIREVYLCGRTPWVYARTLALEESRHWLEQLGTQPLGERVFGLADTHRSQIEVAQVYPADRLYEASVHGLKMRPSALWARRSVLVVADNRLLIYECFLPGMEV
jgi:chorismate lyase